MGLYVSNLVHGVLNGIELELVFNLFISCSIAEISLVEIHHQHIELQPTISQQQSKILKSCMQVLILRRLEPYIPNLQHLYVPIDIGKDRF